MAWIDRFKIWLCEWLGLSRELKRLGRQVEDLQEDNPTVFNALAALQKQIDMLRLAAVHKDPPKPAPVKTRTFREFTNLTASEEEISNAPR